MYDDPRTSIKTLIHPTQLFIKLQLLDIDQKWTQYSLSTNMAVSNLCKYPWRHSYYWYIRTKHRIYWGWTRKKFEETNWNKITEEELEYISPDLNQTFLSPTMNSGLMTVRHNDLEISIDNPENFFQYRSWRISRHKENTLHPTTTKFSTSQLDGWSNSHVLTVIIIFIQIRLIKCYVQIINGRKAPANFFGLVIIKIPKTKISYHSSHHIICHKTHKAQSVKLHSNITINSEVWELRHSDGYESPYS